MNGVNTEYTTNELNQYLTVGTTTMQYDRDGSLVAEVGPDGTRTYTYDSQNRLVKVVTPQGTTEYSYDAIGNRTVVVANGVETQYEWDPFGLGIVTGEYKSSGSRTVSTYTDLDLAWRRGRQQWDWRTTILTRWDRQLGLPMRLVRISFGMSTSLLAGLSSVERGSRINLAM